MEFVSWFFWHQLNLFLPTKSSFDQLQEQIMSKYFLLLTFLPVFALLSLGNLLVVTELIHGGSLENLLKAKRAPGENNKYHNVCCKLNDRQLVTIAFQIAAGMQHLEERKVRPTDNV